MCYHYLIVCERRTYVDSRPDVAKKSFKTCPSQFLHLP